MSLPDPYYQQDGAVIYHGDCREILPELPKIDLLISDPPYGISYQGGGGGKSIHSKRHTGRHRKSEEIPGDAEPFNPSHLLDFKGVAIFGAQHYYNSLPAGGTFHIWDKRAEYKPIHLADFDTIWINRKEVGRIVRCFWRGLCRETENRNKILHPTQKPERVISWIFDMFPEDGLVCDPYLGSGTTLKVALHRRRDSVGIEVKEKYCEIAAKRLEAWRRGITFKDIEQGQRSLFDMGADE